MPEATAKDIILAITDNLHQGVEPLLYKTLVPSIYDVYLHFEDYERLQGVFPKLIQEAKQALDEELEKLNRDSHLPWIFKYLPVVNQKPMQFERSEADWYISIFKNTDEDTKQGDIVIDSHFTLPSTPQFGAGSKTKRIITLHSGGESKTMKKTYEEEPETQALARISFEDDQYNP